MTSTNSSPFVEHPYSSRAAENDQSVDRSVDPSAHPSVLEPHSETSLRQQISSLKFKLESAHIEKQLLQQQKEASEATYQDMLTKKSKEYNHLKKDFDFLYDEKTSVESKLQNQNQIHQAKVAELHQTINSLKKENATLDKNFANLESKSNRALRKFDQVRSDFNYQLRVNDELNSRVKTMQETVERLETSNSELVHSLDAKFRDTSNDTLVETLQIKNSNLLRINSQLQLKLDRLLQNKTQNELLKQKNISLASKIEHLEGIEEKYCELEIENIELKGKFDEYFGVLDESIDTEQDPATKIASFVAKFKELQYQTVLLKSQVDEQTRENDHDKRLIRDLEHQLNELDRQACQFRAQLGTKDDQIQKLEKQKALNTREIEFLRNSLTELDRKVKERGGDNKVTEQYLKNLEKLVDDYKTEITSLQKHLAQVKNNQTTSLPGSPTRKRPRTSTVDSDKAHSTEITHLRSSLQHAETTIEALKKKVDSLHQIKQKKDQLQVLQLKSNPLFRDQLVKQASLEALKNENLSLIKKYIDGDETAETVPKAVFERQEDDKVALQNKIDQLSKRIQRLTNIYSAKSRDILSTISRYFGYTLEFIPSPINPNDISSRIKLTSRFASKNQDDTSSYVVIDMETKSLKAYGNAEFKKLYIELSETYGYDQIPNFLSALNLKLYEKFAKY